MASNNFNQSIIHFQKVLERSPNNIESILQLGEIHLRINNFNDALEKFDKVLELSPNHPQALEQKISALEKMGNTEEAIECCNAIEGVSPNSKEILLKKGILLYNSHEPGKALAIFGLSAICGIWPCV